MVVSIGTKPFLIQDGIFLTIKDQGVGICQVDKEITDYF
jgi:hypothetical protein